MTSRRTSRALARHVDARNASLNLVSNAHLSVASAVDRTGRATEYTVAILGSARSPRACELKTNTGERLLLAASYILSLQDRDGPEPQVDLREYRYRILVDNGDARSEIVAFHWTPDAPSPQRRYPHLHVGSVVTAGSLFRPGDFNKLHIPTGRVSLEDVLIFAVEELGVEPTHGRTKADALRRLREGVGEDR